MKLKEIQDEIAAEFGMSKAKSGRVITRLIARIAESLDTDGKFRLSSLGILKVKARKARTCRNPKTGLPINVPARLVVTYTQSKAIKEFLND
jgi:nucleoid DNA-binding protein